jgi:exonuclease SbcD
MRILHTADWHLGDRLGRIDRTDDLRRAVERVAGYCEQEQVDVLLVAGDLFSELSRPDNLRESIEHLQQVLLPFVRRGGTVVAITGNHDNESFCQTLRHAMTLAAPAASTMGDLQPGGRVYLASEPAFFQLRDRTGQPVQFVLLPYPTPTRYLDAPAQRYPSALEKHLALQAACAAKLRALRADPSFDAGVPTVLAAHLHVQGARLPNLFRVGERESVVFPVEELPVDWAYVALGHIHQPQCLKRWAHVRYSGSIERLDLGETKDDKGVVLVDIGPHGRCGKPVCLPLEATPIYALQIKNAREELPRLRHQYPDAGRALVRYHLTYTAGTDNLEAILRELDVIFPRWYDRDWCEAGALGAGSQEAEPEPAHKSFQDIVLDYVKTELAEHADRDAVLGLAGELLAEEQ